MTWIAKEVITKLYKKGDKVSDKDAEYFNQAYKYSPVKWVDGNKSSEVKVEHKSSKKAVKKSSKKKE